MPLEVSVMIINFTIADHMSSFYSEIMDMLSRHVALRQEFGKEGVWKM